MNKANSKFRLVCPACKSTNVAQYRMINGPIWCVNCGYRVEHKERGHDFIILEIKDGADKREGRTE